MTRFALRLSFIALILMSAPLAGAMNCVLASAPQLAFGRYEPWSASPQDIQGTVSIECTPARTGEVMDVRVKLVPISSGRMAMRNQETGELLQFRLYRDPARATPVFDDLIFELRAPLAVRTTIPITLYGRIPPGQNAAVGNYRARFTVLLDY